MDISIELIILVVVLTTAFFLFAITFGIKAQRRKVATGNEGMVGEKGVAISSLNPKGEISVHGEIWSCESIDGDIKKGSAVSIIGIENLTLKVKGIV